MKNNFELIKSFHKEYPRILKIAKSLHRLDEKCCNVGFTSRDESRWEGLEEAAEDAANLFGLTSYHQTDPRGGTLYFIEKGQGENYHNGILIY